MIDAKNVNVTPSKMDLFPEPGNFYHRRGKEFDLFFDVARQRFNEIDQLDRRYDSRVPDWRDDLTRYDPYDMRPSRADELGDRPTNPSDYASQEEPSCSESVANVAEDDARPQADNARDATDQHHDSAGQTESEQTASNAAVVQPNAAPGNAGPQNAALTQNQQPAHQSAAQSNTAQAQPAQTDNPPLLAQGTTGNNVAGKLLSPGDQGETTDVNSDAKHNQQKPSMNNQPMQPGTAETTEMTSQAIKTAKANAADAQTKIAPADAQTSDAQADTTNGSSADANKKNPNLIEMTTSNTTRPVAPDNSAATHDILAADKANEPRAADMQQNIDRIVKAARTVLARGSARIQLRLEPPEMGTLRINIKQNADGLHLQLQATNAKAQQLLQQHSDHLKAALQRQGIQTNQIDIQLRLDLRHDPAETSQHDQQRFNDPSQPQDHSGDPQSQGPADHLGDDRDTGDTWDHLLPEDNHDPDDNQTNPNLNEKNQWQEIEFARVDLTV